MEALRKPTWGDASALGRVTPRGLAKRSHRAYAASTAFRTLCANAASATAERATKPVGGGVEAQFVPGSPCGRMGQRFAVVRAGRPHRVSARQPHVVVSVAQRHAAPRRQGVRTRSRTRRRRPMRVATPSPSGATWCGNGRSSWRVDARGKGCYGSPFHTWEGIDQP